MLPLRQVGFTQGHPVLNTTVPQAAAVLAMPRDLPAPPHQLTALLLLLYITNVR